MIKTDYLVIGSGISGLNFALNAAKKGQVLLITKKKLIDSNTNYAQGGIAAVLDKTDDFEKHVSDTLEAGANHNDRLAVEFMVKNAPSAIKRLINLGVKFEQENGELKLGREGGHKVRRIAHVGDYTGREIEHVLVNRVRENKNITIMEDTFAAELILKNEECFGCQVIHEDQTENIFAKATIIATGGAGQLYPATTNPKIATGDGLAMGIRAGCQTKDLEFIQFHPTALNKEIQPKFLISEALRGEGAKIVKQNGQSIMRGKHELEDLAPRSIVAREIYRELKKGPIFLDITHHNREYLEKRFPQITAKLDQYGLDISKDKIPVIPAAHYICGGLVTDLKGRTNIGRLYAFGEVACTGVHGANRLASNSLLEALVFSSQIAEDLSNDCTNDEFDYPIPERINSEKLNNKIIQKYENEIKKLMWQHAGISRNPDTINSQAIPKIQELNKKISQIKDQTVAAYELENLATVAEKVLIAASKRIESLGCHYVDK